MLYKIKKPFVLTIFGASGDLAKIKIFPALYELARQNRFPTNFYIVGFSRTNLSRQEFQKIFSKAVIDHAPANVDKTILKKLLSHVYYYSGQYTNKASFVDYKAFLKKLTNNKKHTHITYFSVPPIVFDEIVKNLAETRSSKNEDIRLVIEKPFGNNKESAEDLYHFVSQYFEEEQFYLLDHYLGKSAVQSILHLRRSNRLLNSMINGKEISNIQITAFESIGVKERASYFDHTGTTKDMLQSHMLQVLALLTMAIPCGDSAESLQREKNSILSAINCPCDPENIVLGQYKGYKNEKGVSKTSNTETFAAMRLFIDRLNWFGVPIYIRSGKKLHEKHTYIVIEFKKFPFQPKHEQPNRLIIELQPIERVNITLTNKHEDVSEYQEITTSDTIACSIDGCLPEHGTLLLDIIRGDKTHFLSFAEILSAWEIVDEVGNLIRKKKILPHKYMAKTKGPKEQDSLTKKDGFSWYDIKH